MARAAQIQRLAARRPGPLGWLLLPFTWLLLGVLVVVYFVAMISLGFAAVVVHTVRLFLSPLSRSTT